MEARGWRRGRPMTRPLRGGERRRATTRDRSRTGKATISSGALTAQAQVASDCSKHWIEFTRTC